MRMRSYSSSNATRSSARSSRIIDSTRPPTGPRVKPQSFEFLTLNRAADGVSAEPLITADRASEREKAQANSGHAGARLARRRPDSKDIIRCPAPPCREREARRNPPAADTASRAPFRVPITWTGRRSSLRTRLARPGRTPRPATRDVLRVAVARDVATAAPDAGRRRKAHARSPQAPHVRGQATPTRTPPTRVDRDSPETIGGVTAVKAGQPSRCPRPCTLEW
jgi:hypothetical protein